MTVLRLHKAEEETATSESSIAIESSCVSVKSTEDGGAANFSLPQLPAPETIASGDLATKLAAADAAISNIQQLLGEIRISHDELRRTLNDLKLDRDAWRGRAERPWWRRLAG